MLYMLYLTSTKRSADEQRTYVHVILDEVIFFSFQLLVMYLDEQSEGEKSSFSILFLSKGLSHELLTIYIRHYRAFYIQRRQDFIGIFFILKRKQTIHYMPAFHIGKRYAMVFCTKFKKKVRSKNQFELKAFQNLCCKFQRCVILDNSLPEGRYHSIIMSAFVKIQIYVN